MPDDYDPGDFRGLKNKFDELKNEKIPNDELTKVKNKVESTDAFSHISALNKAMRLSYFELLGDANLANQEIEKHKNVTTEDIKRVLNESIIETNCSTLYYLSDKEN